MGQSPSRGQNTDQSQSSPSRAPSSPPPKPGSLPLKKNFYSTAPGTQPEKERLHVFETAETGADDSQLCTSSQLIQSRRARRRRRCNVTGGSPRLGNYSRPNVEFEEVTDVLEASDSGPAARFRWHYWKTQAWRPRNSPEQTQQLHTPICCLGVCCCCRGEVFSRIHLE